MIETLVGEFQAWVDSARTWLMGMTSPWRLIQFAMIAAIWCTAHVVARYMIDGPARAWMRGLEGMKTWQLRLLLTLQRRSRSILFVLIAWLVVFVMREVTWPSRSYLIGIAATLGAAIVLVAVTTRLIRNSLLRNLVRYAAWAWVTLTVLGLWDRTMVLLDAAAVNFGNVHFSLLVILKAVVVLAILLTVAAWASRLSANRLAAIDDLSPSLRVLSEKLISIALYGFAIVTAIRFVGFDLTSLTVLSGAIGIGVGFGLQKVVSNFVSGFILLLDKSIKPGDVISLGDTFGWIQSLSARYVSVVTRDGREFLIPNEDLITNQVVNWSHSNDLIRLDIAFGVSYDSDPHQVRALAVQAVETVDRVQKDPPAVCHITGFGDSSIDFIMRFWISDPSGGLTNVRGRVFLALWDVLKEHDIEIPFPRRDVTVLNAPALPGPPAGDPSRS